MLELPDLSQLPDAAAVAVRVGLIALAAIVAFLAARAGIRIGVRHLLDRGNAQAGPDALPPDELERRVNTIGRLLLKISGGLVVIIAVLMVLNTLGVEIGAAIAGLGVAGIAVGLGAQTLVRDWLAGIFIVLENQFSEGDIVRIAGVEGVVEDFDLRRTTLRDLDGTVHTVPNGQITVASNLTRLWARVNLDIGIAADADIDRATEVINRVGEEMFADPAWSDRLLEAPKVYHVAALTDAAASLKVLGRVKTAEQWTAAGELRKRVKAAFAREGIQLK